MPSKRSCLQSLPNLSPSASRTKCANILSVPSLTKRAMKA